MSGSLPSLCDTFIPAIRISNLFDLSEVWKILHHLEKCWSLLCLALGTIPPWLPPWSGACGPREEMWKPSRKVTYQLPEALSGLRNQHARFAQSTNPQRAGSSKWPTMSWPNRATLLAQFCRPLHRLPRSLTAKLRVLRHTKYTRLHSMPAGRKYSKAAAGSLRYFATATSSCAQDPHQVTRSHQASS